MLIEYEGARIAGDFRIASALVTWEDAHSAPYRIYYGVDRAFSAWLSEVVDPFLALCVVPAIWGGERRIRSNEPACPVLLEGLGDFDYLHKSCFELSTAPLAFDVGQRPSGRDRAITKVAASLFSGGVDSLFTIHDNHRRYSATGDERIRCAVHCTKNTAFNSDGIPTPVTDRALDIATPLLGEQSVEIVRVLSNYRSLWTAEDHFFWSEKWHGPAFISAGHCLAERLHTLFVPSSGIDVKLIQWGSNPLTDPNLSSSRLAI